MSGWEDWFDDEIICPSCNSTITVIILEDGDSDGNITYSIAGEQKCPHCNYNITDKDLEPSTK